MAALTYRDYELRKVVEEDGSYPARQRDRNT